MVLGWFGGAKEESLPELIAQKKYAQAVELLRAQAQQGGGRDPRLRMQLADILDAAGRRAEAIPIYLELADGFAREGYVAKAIAVLKKVERIDQRPRRRQGTARAPRGGAAPPILPARPSRWRRVRADARDRHRGDRSRAGRSRAHRIPPPQPRPCAPVAPKPHAHARARRRAATEADPGCPQADREHRGRGHPRPRAGGAGARPSPRAGRRWPTETCGPEEEFFDALAETVKASGSAPRARCRRRPTRRQEPAVRGLHRRGVPRRGGPAGAALVRRRRHRHLRGRARRQPLRPDHRRRQGLRAQPGRPPRAGARDGGGIVLRRDLDPHRQAAHRHRHLRDACDLLELDRDALDAIAATHPRVQKVLQAFYLERHGSGEEKLVRGTEAAAQQ